MKQRYVSKEISLKGSVNIIDLLRKWEAGECLEGAFAEWNEYEQTQWAEKAVLLQEV